MLAALGLAVVLVAAPQSPRAAEPAAAAEPSRQPATLVLVVRGAEAEAVRDAVRLRLSDRPVVAERTARAGDTVAYSELRFVEGGAEITLVMPDGRAFDRTVAADPDGTTRVAASTLANLVFSVEAGEVVPDRTSVPIPPEARAEAPTDAPQRPRSRERAAATPPALRPPPSPPPVEIGPGLQFGALFGLAPRTRADAVAAAGGGVDLDVRARSGAAGSFGLRAMGLGREDVRLARVRLAFGGGWIFRVRWVELPLVALATIEPWTVRRGGRAATIVEGGDTRSRPPLVGGLVRFSPGLLVRPTRARDLAIRVGLRLELAGSFAVDDGARTIDLAIARGDGTTAPGFRLGGFELGIGVDATVWLGIRHGGRRSGPPVTRRRKRAP